MKDAGKDLKRFGLDKELPKIFSAVGCDECNMTGYKGRVGIFEAVRTDAGIEKLMLENPSEREIKKVASAQGMLTLREDGVVKVLAGITSLAEVASVVDLAEE
jgi:type II secretory ATPase GspE/PulE/Tfp pilus assembly ATPase PilB-like protein